MRRLFPLVALFTLSWSQVAALQCPLAAAQDSRATQSADPIAPGLHPHGRPSAHGDGLPVSSGMDCRVAMTCAWAMIDPAAAVPALELAAPLHRYRGSIRTPHAAADLLTEPPPPRLIA